MRYISRGHHSPRVQDVAVLFADRRVAISFCVFRLSSLQTGTVVKGDVVMPIATLVEPSQIIRRSSHPGLSTPLTLTSQSANWNDQQEFLVRELLLLPVALLPTAGLLKPHMGN